MIIFGVIAIILGGILLFNGNSINNDIDAQMESIFNDGVSNPGSSYEIFGILLLVVGFALLIIGAVISSNKTVDNTSSTDGEENNLQTTETQPLTCKKCGFSIAQDSKFCMECGEPVVLEKQHDQFIVCPYCAGQILHESKFCMHCGKDVTDRV